MSSDMLVIAFHFSPLNVKQTCFPSRARDSPCMYNVPSAYAYHPSKFHRDRISRLDTVHPHDQQTDKQLSYGGHR